LLQQESGLTKEVLAVNQVGLSDLLPRSESLQKNQHALSFDSQIWKFRGTRASRHHIPKDAPRSVLGVVVRGLRPVYGNLGRECLTNRDTSGNLI
jgi:hypothetical protein